MDKTTIRLALYFAHQTSLGRSLHQADYCVVTLLQELGQFADGGPFAVRIARDPEQKLVLLRSNAFRAGGLLAETQESTKVVTKPGKAPDQLAVEDR